MFNNKDETLNKFFEDKLPNIKIWNLVNTLTWVPIQQITIEKYYSTINI
jgi:hypothetical protein